MQYPLASAASFVGRGVGSSSMSNMSMEGVIGRVDGAVLVYNRGGGVSNERLAKTSSVGGHGHSAPVTCIATPINGGSVFRDLVVTCSMDWSLKLWSVKVRARIYGGYLFLYF